MHGRASRLNATTGIIDVPRINLARQRRDVMLTQVVSLVVVTLIPAPPLALAATTIPTRSPNGISSSLRTEV